MKLGERKMSASEESGILDMLDKLMLAKNRPLLSEKAKDVWLDELKGVEHRRIMWAIKQLIRQVGPFPEVANVIEGCREYAVVHAEQLAKEEREKNLKSLLEYEANMLPTMEPVPNMTPDEIRRQIRG